MRTVQWLVTTLLTSALIACGGEDHTIDGGGEGGAGAGVGSGGSTSTGGTTSTASGELVINEIMYNPDAVWDDAGEWLEIFNPTDEPIDLSGWSLRGAGNKGHVITALTVEPGQYAVLAANGDSAQNGGVEVDYVYGGDYKLSNDGDTVVLEDAAGKQVDVVVYDVGGEWPVGTPGLSIELEAESFDNAVATNWVHAVVPYGDGDLGTPGAPNGGDLSGYAIDESVVSWHNPDLKTAIHFAPLDDVEAKVLEQLSSAQASIKLAFFNLRLGAVKDLLVLKHNAGVDVQVLLDNKQQELSYNTMGEQLVQLGINVTMVENGSAENATMHDKFAIIDDHLVMTGSANYSYTALNVSDEEIIVFDNEALAARYQLEFEEIIAAGDVSSAPYVGNEPLQAWMGPEDGLSYKVVEMLDEAQSTVVIAMFQLNTQMIVDAIISAHQRGVKVVVVLDDVQAGEADATADETLSAAGVAVVLAHNTDSTYAEMHSKFMVCDHQKVLMGSFNWTNLGSFFNDENVVIIDDAHMAARFEGRVAELLEAYNGPSAASLGLTTGVQMVSFDVSNVVLDPGVKLFVVSDNSGPFPTGLELDGSAASVAAGTRLSYHYEIRHEGTTLAVDGGQRSFTVPYAPGPFVVHDAFTQ